MDYSIFATAFTLFLVTNPIGNSPAIIALIKDFDLSKQKKILIRETLLSFLIALFFQFFGEIFLSVLQLQDYAVALTGGLLLFFVALSMIFSVKGKKEEEVKKDPFLVPIATPLLSGPGLLTTIMIFAKEQPPFMVTSAIAIAWVGVAIVLYAAPAMQRGLGKRGMVAFEQIMGMLLAMISMDIMVGGLQKFLKVM